MRFAVIGAGGLGGYFGAKLAAGGHEVAFLARGATLAALRRDGIRVVGVGELHVPAVRADEDAAALGPVDAVLLTVKTTHIAGVLPAVATLCGPDTPVLTLQNGVETPGVVAEVVGAANVLPCIVRIFTKIAEPGVIEHMGGPGSVAFDEPDLRATPRRDALRAAFRESGVLVEEPADVWVELWEKAAYVAPVGALGALVDEPIGVLRTRLRDSFGAVMAEIAEVGRARGVPLSADVVERTLAFADQMPPDATASMHRDILAGRPNELDGQVGAIVRLGRDSGVPTPLHELLYGALSLRETG